MTDSGFLFSGEHFSSARAKDLLYRAGRPRRDVPRTRIRSRTKTLQEGRLEDQMSGQHSDRLLELERGKRRGRSAAQASGYGSQGQSAALVESRHGPR